VANVATLTVSEFSCLHYAVFTLSPVNIIIGPQGSGKSVTTKLFYFFTDMLSNSLQAAERGDTYEQFKKHLARQFAMWFPSSAWGSGRFNLSYVAEPFTARVLRRVKKGELTDEVAVTFSDWFADTYDWMRDQFQAGADSSELDLDTDLAVVDVIDRAFRTREQITRRFSQQLGANYLSQQTFIPAGRAFFTSIGRLVAGIEQAGSLDPVTIKFAKLFANLRDRMIVRSPTLRSHLGEDFLRRRERFMGELFGGEVRFENDAEFVLATDGRRIPFTSLSSGQQELLPMWSLVDYFSELDERRANRGNSIRRQRVQDLVYIEEPEAHLFPSAQSLLMEFLIGSVASERNNRKLILTTHSPYIMSKLNVFLKAGQLARRKKRNSDINEIVPRECWLSSGQLSAYSIENGKLHSLLDQDGLIDGAYLDAVSDEIGSQFDRLLELELEM
jgi:hypothetical protein